MPRYRSFARSRITKATLSYVVFEAEAESERERANMCGELLTRCLFDLLGYLGQQIDKWAFDTGKRLHTHDIRAVAIASTAPTVVQVRKRACACESIHSDSTDALSDGVDASNEWLQICQAVGQEQYLLQQPER